MSKSACVVCHTERGGPGTWWHLSDYYGLRGWFCSACYERVSHDPYGVPKHPKQYEWVKAILEKRYE
jgi:hypothetical protein